MKKILFFLFSLGITLSLTANPINPEQASKLAKNFYLQMCTSKGLSNPSLNLAFTSTSQEISIAKGLNEQETPLYFIYNVNDNDGFVIIAADDIVTPILGYSDTGNWNENNMPPALQDWMENYKDQIIYAIKNNLLATFEIQQQWNDLQKENNNTQTSRKHDASLPSLKSSVLLPTASWNQGNTNAGGFYNDLCPYDPSLPNSQCNLSTHCVTGCPATAMAIIMKYWNYPTSNSLIPDYTPQHYTTQHAVNNYSYNWSAMSTTDLTSANIDVATLMFNCGVSVDMGYGACGSGTPGILSSENATSCQRAYSTYFGYDPSTIQGVQRDGNYTDANWINLIENELNNNRPIQYAGLEAPPAQAGSGHTWVCDGYDANNNLHMNWGWGGVDNGYYYSLTNLNTALGGQNNGTFLNTGHEAIIGVQPLGGGTTANIQLYSSITITPNPINFEQSFTVNADVYNAGSSDFNGDFCAALFDASGNFIDYVQTLTTGNNPLPPGYDYSGGLTFSNTGILTAPGNYIIGIYYRPTGGNWYLASDISYTNPVSLTISSPAGNTNGSPNNLEIYSTITPSPTTFIQGQAASVNVNFANYNNYTYYGQYKAALYDLSGNFVQTIGTYNETAGLPANYAYGSPYITFSTSAITASPGTYFLTIAEEEQGTSLWYYVGGDYYNNPITIDVIAAPLIPDIYESNNAISTAYTLPLSWSSNNAHLLTTGSNLHISTDIDYYRINLLNGYNYTITARVHDSYNSGNGNNYTCDVNWSYNTGGVWSTSYDDIMPGNIIINGAGSVTFLVVPYYTGLTGTYLLDINITRASTTGIETQPLDDLLSIYPNPSCNFFNIEYKPGFDKGANFKIFDITGKLVLQNELKEHTNEVDISNLTKGVYFIRIFNGDKTFIKKLSKL